MKNTHAPVREFKNARIAASLTSYGLVVGLIAILAIAAVSNVGDGVDSLLTNVGTELDGAATGAGGSGGSSGGSGGGSTNTAPTAPALSANTIDENNSANDVIGTLSATDPDAGQSVSFSLSGPDASHFTIGGTGNDELQAVTIFDFEDPEDANLDNVYAITVTATDDGSPAESTSANFSITIGNDEAEIGPSGQIVCPTGPLVASQPPSGDLGCDDGFGNFFAGYSNGDPLYAADSDDGFTSWDDGTSNFINSELPDPAYTDGRVNTELLAAGDDGLHIDSSSAGGTLAGSNPPGGGNSPHAAAELCASRDDGQFDDWYLPALNELVMVIDNLVDQDSDNSPEANASTTFNFVTSGTFATVEYWASSENDASSDGWRVRTTDEQANPNNKSTSRNVRCVRR